MSKCEFDNNGECKALACYSREQCNSRDKKGYPIYSTKVSLKNLKVRGKK